MKRGRFSEHDKQYIKDNCEIMSYVEIARDINRSPNKVRDYIEKDLGKTINLRKDSGHTISSVRTKKFWRSLEEQFSPSELDMFEFHWNRINEQFKQDVLPTEELQILDLIKLEILMGRNLIQQHQSAVQLKTLSDDLIREKAKDTPDLALVAGIMAQINALAAAQGSLNRDYREFQAGKEKIFQKLKATRDQRIKRIEAGKESFPVWLSQLINDKEKRRELGIKMEKMRLAMEKEYERLSAFHTYQDKKVDRPLLLPEVLEKEEENGKDS